MKQVTGKKVTAPIGRGSDTGHTFQHIEDGAGSYLVHPITGLAEVSIADVVDSGIDSSGPADDFIYLDIGGVDREKKTFAEPKLIPLAKAPSRARQKVQVGDILVSMTRPNLNAVAQITQELHGSIASTGFHVLRSPWIETGFLYYLVQTDDFVDAMCGVVQGALYPAVRPRDIEAFKFYLPPRAQQTRIVEKLEELLSDLDAGVAELKAAQRKLVQYRQSLLKAAVEGALTADWRATSRSVHPEPVEGRALSVHASTSSARTDKAETGADLLQRILTERRTRWEARQLAKFAEQGKTPPKGWQAKYPEPVTPDATDLHRLPHGWVWATVDQVSLEQRYGSSAKTDENADGVPVLRMGNIQDGELDLSRMKYLPREHHEFPDLFLEDGELLFNRTNSPELVGKTAVYRSQVTRCSYASYLISVKLSPSCLPELVAAYINSAHGRRWVKSVVTQQVGQANVNGTKLAALAVPLPPEEEQREIVKQLLDQLSSATKQATEIERSLKQSAAQRKNILKAAFAGQLVPQDPNDEPASVLLERICAERDHLIDTTKPRGRKPRQMV